MRRADSLHEEMVAALVHVFPAALCDLGQSTGKIERDEQMLDALMRAETPSTRLRLWDNHRCLVTSRRIAKLPLAGAACVASEARGWPVSVRASGGTTVAHGPGNLNVSWFHVSSEPHALKSGFDNLCSLIVRAAALIGIPLAVGRHTGAYCAGSHDIGWDGQKVAGTAGIARRLGATHGSVFHASIAVSSDARAEFEAIQSFEQQAGLPGLPVSYELGRHTTLAEIATRDPAARMASREQTTSPSPLTK